MGRQYIDAGADLVIGSHPHVLQGIEYYQGKPIVYSLGNFVFGSSIPRTMLLQASLGADGVKLTAVHANLQQGIHRRIRIRKRQLHFIRSCRGFLFMRR